MLVRGVARAPGDIFQLGTDRAGKTRGYTARPFYIGVQIGRGIDDLNRQTNLLQCLAHRRTVGQLVGLNVPTRRQPSTKFLVVVQHDRSVANDEDRDGVLAAHACTSGVTIHGSPAETREPRKYLSSRSWTPSSSPPRRPTRRPVQARAR